MKERKDERKGTKEWNVAKERNEGKERREAQIVNRFLRWRGLSQKEGTTMVNANDTIKTLFDKLQSTSR